MRPVSDKSSISRLAFSPAGQEVSRLPPARNSVRPARALKSKSANARSLPDKTKDVSPADNTWAGRGPVRRLPPKSRLVNSAKSPIWAGTVPEIRFASTSALGRMGNARLAV